MEIPQKINKFQSIEMKSNHRKLNSTKSVRILECVKNNLILKIESLLIDVLNLFLMKMILFSCCWPSSLQHQNNTDTEKIVRGRRRPTKNRYWNVSVKFVVRRSLWVATMQCVRSFFFLRMINGREGPCAYSG